MSEYKKLETLKSDAGKPFASIPFTDFPRALSGVIAVGTFGANKYTRLGWKQFSIPGDPNTDTTERLLDAFYRHQLAYFKGEHYDLESGQLHFDHVAWNALAISEVMHMSLEGGTGAKPNIPQALKQW